MNIENTAGFGGIFVECGWELVLVQMEGICYNE